MRFLSIFVVYFLNLNIELLKTQSTQYTTRDGYKYDFSSPKKDSYWEAKQKTTDSGLFTMAYIFNFDSTKQPWCQGKLGSYETIYVQGHLTDSCELMGQFATQIVSEIQDHQGITITQTEGGICQVSENSMDVGKPKSINFKIFCNRVEDFEWKFSTPDSMRITSCNVELIINHPAGCYQTYFSCLQLLKIIICILILYLVAGYCYNARSKGIVGIQAIPHNAIWRNIPQITLNLFMNCYFFIILSFKSAVMKLKIVKGNKGYYHNNESYSNI